MVVQDFTIKHQSGTISATWKVHPFTDTNNTTQEPSNKEGINSSTSSSQHRRNCPACRNPDFSWL